MVNLRRRLEKLEQAAEPLRRKEVHQRELASICVGKLLAYGCRPQEAREYLITKRVRPEHIEMAGEIKAYKEWLRLDREAARLAEQMEGYRRDGTSWEQIVENSPEVREIVDRSLKRWLEYSERAHTK